MAAEELQDIVKWTNVFHQYCATVAVNLIAISHGCVIGWSSGALPKLASNSTPLLSGPLTNEEISWVGSINAIGALLGSLIVGYLTTLIGSKRVALLLAVPAITFWSLIYFGNTYLHILIARLIGGMTGGGSQCAIILFVSEIANDDIRGRLGSIFLFFRNTGTLIGYILGGYVEYEIIPCINVIIPIVFVVVFMMMPNTPQFYLRKGQIQKAEDALKFYKGYRGKNQQEDNAIQKEFERLKSIASERKKDEKLHLADFCNRSALKGIGIGIALTTFGQCTAIFAITSYAVTTFAKVGTTTIDPYISSIILAVALIIGSLTTTYLADKFGRKMLNLISLMGSACGLLATALYYYLNLRGFGSELSTHAWIPIVSLSSVIFFSSAGIATLANVCSVEYLPSKIRTYGMTIISCSLGFVSFISVKAYPILLESVDLHGCLSIYGGCCIIGFIFIIVVLKETSGKSLDDVGSEQEMNSKF